MGAGDDPYGEETPLQQPVASESANAVGDKKSVALIISFILMVFIGLGNKIFNILETIPMNNYMYFLNIYSTFIYVPLSFLYIIPMILWGKEITPEQRAIPLYKFAIMGCLDGIAGILQLFATGKLSNNYPAWVILLMQAAIPISMGISKVLMKIKYEIQHYIGSAIVIGGLMIVLVPIFVHPSKPSPSESHPLSSAMLGVWSVVLVLSCVPMTLSSVYKEKALGEQEIDVVYLNGWVAVFQVLVSIPLGIPMAYALGLTIQELPQNFIDGAKCYCNMLDNPPPGVDCSKGPLFVNVYMFFNVIYNILIILILKYGSSNILWLAMTIMVPLGNAAFSLKFMPNYTPMANSDIAGLVVIMGGLVLYRF